MKSANMKYSKRIAAAAGSLASLAVSPAMTEGSLIHVTGSPVSLSTAAPNGTSVTWDIDGTGAGEFRLWNLDLVNSKSVLLASNTVNGGQGNGRGFVGPASPTLSDDVQALAQSFNVGPTVSPLAWGQGSGFYGYRNAMQSNAGVNAIGYDFVGFQPGDNFIGFRFDDGVGAGLNYGFAVINLDTTTGTVTIKEWTYETVDDASVHVEASQTVPIPEPSSLALLACGAAGVIAYRNRRKRRATEKSEI